MRIQSPTAAKEAHLADLLAARGRQTSDPSLAAVVEDAQILGSLELAGFRFSWDDVRAARSGDAPGEVLALRRAHAAVPRDARVDRRTLRAWHEALVGPAGFRRAPRAREDAPTAPPELIESRLETLEEWLAAAGLRDLRAEQAAGLAYARIMEILPFDDANGRVARLAASHLMVARSARPPILVGSDGPYLLACLRAAFRLDTEPLVSLLVEASGRGLDVMIQSLERGEA